MKKLFIFTHHDLDGAVCYLLTKWAHPEYTIEYKSVAMNNFRKELTTWLLHNNFGDYEKIFILDIDCLEDKDLIDRENVMVIDHHQTLLDLKAFKNAVVISKEYSSAVKLAYKVFKKLYNITLTEPQKKLIALADDYDSYKLQLTESRILNTVFWETNKNFNSFIKNFENGFSGFDKHQLAIYNIFLNELKELINKSSFFEANIKISNKPCKVVSTFATNYINDVAEYILEKFSADIAIVVNLKTDHVSFRRGKTDVDLSKIASKLCDGDGHEYSSGGVITKQFLEFTNLLKPIKI